MCENGLCERRTLAWYLMAYMALCSRKLGQPTRRPGNRYQLVCKKTGEKWLPTYL